MNLACKAALGAITDVQYADSGSEYEPPRYGKDCIATIHSLTNAVTLIIFWGLLYYLTIIN